jgi:hypothetical protein
MVLTIVKPKQPTTPKDLEVKNVPRGKASNNTSKGKQGISRTKKPTPAIAELIAQANKPTHPNLLKFQEAYAQLRYHPDVLQRPEDIKAVLILGDFLAVVERQQQGTKTLLLEIIKLAKLGDIDYLGQCQNCENIFFAGRKDQQGCSPGCLNKIRKQRWRKSYADAKAGEKRGYLKLEKQARAHETKRIVSASKRSGLTQRRNARPALNPQPSIQRKRI